jgi:hypothetical protein
MSKAVIAGLKAAINDHGPITRELITSAAKRIVGHLRNADQPSDADMQFPCGCYYIGLRADFATAKCQYHVHASDCAVHNEPAYPAGACDCGAADQQSARPEVPGGEHDRHEEEHQPIPVARAP